MLPAAGVVGRSPSCISTPCGDVAVTAQLFAAGTLPDPRQCPIPAPSCCGDCNSDNQVSREELDLCFQIQLGGRRLSECPQCDCNNGGEVDIGDLVQIGNNFSQGCPGGPGPEATPTDTPTPTPSPTKTPPPTPVCGGDCSGDGKVTVNEIIAMVSVALGSTPISTCSAGDADGSGKITVNEIVAAVNYALAGCQPHATPLPMHTARRLLETLPNGQVEES